MIQYLFTIVGRKEDPTPADLRYLGFDPASFPDLQVPRSTSQAEVDVFTEQLRRIGAVEWTNEERCVMAYNGDSLIKGLRRFRQATYGWPSSGKGVWTWEYDAHPNLLEQETERRELLAALRAARDMDEQCDTVEVQCAVDLGFQAILPLRNGHGVVGSILLDHRRVEDTGQAASANCKRLLTFPRWTEVCTSLFCNQSKVSWASGLSAPERDKKASFRAPRRKRNSASVRPRPPRPPTSRDEIVVNCSQKDSAVEVRMLPALSHRLSAVGGAVLDQRNRVDGSQQQAVLADRVSQRGIPKQVFDTGSQVQESTAKAQTGQRSGQQTLAREVVDSDYSIHISSHHRAYAPGNLDGHPSNLASSRMDEVCLAYTKTSDPMDGFVCRKESSWNCGRG
ncbi:hypothetical protein BP00DRAFT_448756 [Aspergillus indologenus CBS 114.80]|uniref:Uncharacterized protein n=1 Tax=Aspergillus indologenus CBS 114.80 TaxID=1450541 RepID=A0A2V5IXR0_9EURO|nr:hypothetical protein BP00DRAFT_448756 [Aspergillus indologenus CBS 114.80]